MFHRIIWLVALTASCWLVASSWRTIVSADVPSHGARDPASAVANLDLHDELTASLFAAEPDLLNPSNIDIDHRGRIWICEIVNYRKHRDRRPEGDRILILEDTDGDAKADKVQTFYQGRDIDSPHGVCVLPNLTGKGTAAIVSANSQVLLLTDEDGDDRADTIKPLFTGISGVQHDHGIHAFVFGPDGKLYFNFGNAGEQLKDKVGQIVVDMAGNEVRSVRRPYQQGMVFRCNLDGSELETLAWNFRNNWMTTVDSFGSIWQSDNDDDGNRGVRINFVMEFGNYGYRDEFTGGDWTLGRTGRHPEIPKRHWHLNDPGVVPNLLQTGAGSPTGITIYEGDLLPAAFHGQILHCDAGPSVCRAYPIEDDGAGYSASMISIMEGTRDNWFRPSDVSIAPDGSIFVADWYDPGVGGHQAGDIDSGRIFRVIPKGGKKQYETPTFDFDSAEGAVEALKNPNYCVRYLAWTALRRMGSRAESALLTLWKSKNPVYRARALWLLGKTKDRGDDYVQLAAGDADPNIRIVAVRLARQLKLDVIPLVRQLASDPNPQVRREAAIALRGCKSPDMPAAWTELAVRHDGQDRWYLEALGIAADGRWDECLETWLERVNHKWNTAAGRDTIWRSRAQQTSALLAQIIEGTDQNTEQLPRYFRAFDFQASDPSQQALFGLVSRPLGESTRDTLIASESVSRLKKLALADNENHRRALANALDASQGTEQFSRLVDRFEVVDRYPALLAVAQADPDSREGVAAMAVLLRKQQKDLIRSAVVDTDRVKGENTVKALGNVADAAIVELLSPVVTDDELALSIRRAAARAMARHREGADILLRWAGEKEMTAILQAAAVPLHAAPWPNVRDQADKLFPLPEVQGPPLPPIAQLVEKSG
ncbi:MAG: PVC-type heme-binding CxxCH protein, partial [Pirellulales bacterium]